MAEPLVEPEPWRGAERWWSAIADAVAAGELPGVSNPAATADAVIGWLATGSRSDGRSPAVLARYRRVWRHVSPSWPGPEGTRPSRCRASR